MRSLTLEPLAWSTVTPPPPPPPPPPLPLPRTAAEGERSLLT